MKRVFRKKPPPAETLRGFFAKTLPRHSPGPPPKTAQIPTPTPDLERVFRKNPPPAFAGAPSQNGPDPDPDP